MILINEEINPEILSNRREQLELIERKLLESNFDKYSILRSLWIFDEIRKGFVIDSRYYGYNYTSSFFCKIVLKENKITFHVAKLQYNKNSSWNKEFPAFLSKISKQTNSYYIFIKVGDGFDFQPITTNFPNRWYSEEIRKSKRYYLTSCPISFGGRSPAFNSYNILRIMTTTNVKIGINSKDGNSINIDIEVSTL